MAIKVAIIGVGNCASSLVQTVQAAKTTGLDFGVSHSNIGKYKIADITFTAAFDVDIRKVSKDLSEAIYNEPNCTTKYIEVPKCGVVVNCGSLLDGVSPHMLDVVKVNPDANAVSMEDVVGILKKSGSEIVISYLPVGSDQASEFYAEAAVKANCGFINCTPAKIATSDRFKSMFIHHKLPLLGDDIKSQIGSTAIHRSLITLLRDKGVKITKTYQLNIGGNTDFKNMREPYRSKGKKFTKEVSLKHLLGNDLELGVGPSDYVPHLKDFKVGYIHIEGVGILGMPFSIELKLNVEDSPNSAGVAINAIRALKLARDQGEYGPQENICPYFFKNPPIPKEEEEVFKQFNDYVSNNMKVEA